MISSRFKFEFLHLAVNSTFDSSLYIMASLPTGLNVPGRDDPAMEPTVEMSRRDMTKAIYEIRDHALQTREIADAKSDALQNTLNSMNETLALILAEVRAGNRRSSQEEGAVGGLSMQSQEEITSPVMFKGMPEGQKSMGISDFTRPKTSFGSSHHPALYPYSSYPPPKGSGWTGFPDCCAKMEVQNQDANQIEEVQNPVPVQEVHWVRCPNQLQSNFCPGLSNDDLHDDLSGESRHQMRQLDPPARSLPKFDGKPDSVVDWTAFIVQFEKLAVRHRWDVVECLDNLIDCLGDHALLFYSRLPEHIREDYHELRDRLSARFNTMDDPPTARRKLQEAKQRPEEHLEEYATRVQWMANIGYPETALAVIQSITIDAFLKGCRDKNMAFLTLNSNPATMDEALRLMNSSATNHQVMFGSPSDNKVRRVLRFEAPARLH